MVERHVDVHVYYIGYAYRTMVTSACTNVNNIKDHKVHVHVPLRPLIFPELYTNFLNHFVLHKDPKIEKKCHGMNRHIFTCT